MMLNARFTSACLLLASVAPAFAVEQDGKSPSPAYGTSLGSSGVMETAGGLILVLILIVGLAWLYRRVGHLPAGGKGMMRVAGGLSLGSRERVVVVEIENQRLVLGVSPGRVQTLYVLDPKEDEKTSPSFNEQLETQLKEGVS